MSVIAIDQFAHAIAPHVGRTGARHMILTGLRQSSLTSRCQRFEGVNANSYSSSRYPDPSENYVLPNAFWSYHQWLEDGELSKRDDRKPWDFWTWTVDWAVGNFHVSGSTGGGTHTISRRAYGVALDREPVRQFLLRMGFDLRKLNLLGDASKEEMLEWLRVKMQPMKFRGQKQVEAEFHERFPKIDLKGEFRDLHSQVKAELIS